MTKINWISIESAEMLDSLIEKSFEHPVLVYKHSTRCGLSSMVRSRLERSWVNGPLDVECYFLDIIAFRQISNEVEYRFGVLHESPQVLLIIRGKCLFHGSHLGVNYQSIVVFAHLFDFFH